MHADVILQLIDKAGDFVSDDIWFRVVQFVTNNEDLQVSMKLELTVAAS
jgi:AP-2 complex subunit alpha